MQPRFNLALRGARDTVPMLVGAAPFGIIFGTLAVSTGLSSWATLGMSVLVFAGASQFIALSLIASGAGLVVILLTTLVVNLRHMLYAASLLPLARNLPQRWLVPMAFWLTDESYAVMQHRLQSAGKEPLWHWYFLGSAIAMYSTWVLCTLAGMLLGHGLPGMASWGLDFAMVATFIGIVVPLLRTTRPMLAAALTAAVVSVALHALPYKLGLMLAALSGVGAGLVAAALSRVRAEGVSDERI